MKHYYNTHILIELTADFFCNIESFKNMLCAVADSCKSDILL